MPKLASWRKAREGGAADATQVVVGIVVMEITSYWLWGLPGMFLAMGIVLYLDIRLDDICNSLSNK